MNLKQELVQHYKWLRQYDCNDSHSGNASVRIGDEIWVTPTGCCADTLTESDLVRCYIDGRIGRGSSLDGPLHVQVYQNNPEAQSVIHSHGPHTVALTLNGENFVPVDFEGNLYFPEVPVITIPYEDYVAQAPAAVAEKLTNYPITVVGGHGVYAQAKSINQAYKWSCSLELSAKTYFIAQQAGTIPK